MKLNKIVTVLIVIFVCTGTTKAAEYFQLPGVVHAHTTVGSGLYSMEALVTMAKEMGLEALVLTDHDLVVIEYGIFPFRSLIKKRVERDSILKLGPEKYLSMISQINQRQKDVLVIPGAQSSPFYYWTGSFFMGDLTAHDYQKELLLIGMLSPEDYLNLPLLHRGFSTQYVKGLILQSIVLLISCILGIYLFFQRGILKVTGILIGIFSIILLINHHPFQSSRFDPYHGDLGNAPFQELIDYVNRHDGLSFWAHPESNYSGRGRKLGPVKMMTTPYVDGLSESENYTGFTAIYGDNITITSPGKKWDQLLNEYCLAERSHPVWGIAGADFHGAADGVKLDKFQTIFLVKGKTMLDVIDAISKGRMYAKQKGKDKGLTLDKFRVENQASGEIALMGEELIIKEAPIVTGKISASDNGHYAVKVLLIKAGKIMQDFEGKTPLDFRFEDRDRWSGKTYYRLDVQGGSAGKLLSNPIFANRKLGLIYATEDTTRLAKDYQEAVASKAEQTHVQIDSEDKVEKRPLSKANIGKIAPKVPAQVPEKITTIAPYSIQVASFTSLDLAQKALQDYQEFDLPAYFVKVSLGNKGTWWRLYIGCFRTQTEAMAARDKYRLSDAMVQKTPYANLVGIFSSEKEITEIKRRLESLKYSPYTIKGPGDSLSLYVGAFITLKGAKDLRRELKTDSMPSQIVKRKMSLSASAEDVKRLLEDYKEKLTSKTEKVKIDSEEKTSQKPLQETKDSQKAIVPLPKAQTGKLVPKILEKTTKKTTPIAPYTIQVASFPSLDLAQKALQDYQEFDLPAYFVKVSLGDKGTWWRLYIGCFMTQTEAMAARDKYRLSDAMVQKTPYANLVGIFSSEKEITEIKRRLESLKYSPYTIKGPGDSLSLYVGAFITLKGSKDLRRELKANGIPTQVVKR
ncbi:SPOR domain-containing protein [Thermodesulfobacteriota bacterium]